MDIPKPDEGDVDIGTGIFEACWVLTAVVGVVLVFRFAVKAWAYWALPKVSSPGRIWGLEDGMFLFAFCLEVLHMALIQKSANSGLGRHFFYLTNPERNVAMKWDFASQPVAVAASMISREGMMWFLYQCFGSNKKTQRILIGCMVIQMVVNSFTILQIVLQCGPNPYRLVDRTAYFHFMWDPLPLDGSVQCQDPTVQATVGFVQGAFNTLIDLSLGVLSAYELWQFLFKTSSRNPHANTFQRFRTLDSSTRSRRIWQTVTLSGPLFLSGVASIVKTVLLKSLGSRLDFTYNIVTFVLWVKIENYSILIATCAPVMRLFLRIFIDTRTPNGAYGSRSRTNGLDGSNIKKSQSELESGRFDRLESQVEMQDFEGGSSRSSMKSEDRIIKEQKIERERAGDTRKPNGVRVKTDITVSVAEGDVEGRDRAKRYKGGEAGSQGGWTKTMVSGPGGRVM